MSEEGGFGIVFAERFFGFLLIVIGVLAFYFAWTSAQALGAFTSFFAFLNLVMIAVGFLLLVAKTE